MSGWAPIDALPLLDEVLVGHEAVLDTDFVPYRNHCYRVANFCLAFAAPDPDRVEKVAIASAFHDLGIWTERTLDYLAPSIRLASTHLVRHARTTWVEEVEAMIREHHKIRSYRGGAGSLVEAFRKADWLDVTRGVRRFGLPRAVLAEVFATWPDAGFGRRLVQLSLGRLRTHPWRPLPMVRW